MMNTALTQSAILIFLIILGYVLKRVGLFRQEDSKVLSNIMLYVTLPAVAGSGLESGSPGNTPGACHVHDLSGRI